jgi:hypothetical protein
MLLAMLYETAYIIPSSGNYGGMKPLTLATEGKKKPLTEPPVRGNTMKLGQYYNLFNNQ